jgi:hypothetical protein
MITASGNYTYVTGSKVLYGNLDTFIIPQVLDDDSIVRVEMRALRSAGVTTGNIGGTHTIELTYATINAFTPSGADDVEKFFNLCEQAVVDYLEGLAENAAVTFTIV